MYLPNKKDPDERFSQFRTELERLGYSKSSVWDYAAGAREYVLTGKDLTKEEIDDYFKNNTSSSYVVNKTHKTGTMLFLKFINGEPIVRRIRKEGRWKKKRFNGCDDDCFNCPYPDCYKPDYLCKSSIYEEEA